MKKKPPPALPHLSAIDWSRLATLARKAGETAEAGPMCNALHVLAEKCDDHARVSQPCEVDDAMTAIAQGAVNISEGHMTIEPGSRVHVAMLSILRFYHEGKLQVRR